MDGKEDPLVKRKKDKMVRTRSKKGTKLEKKPTALEGNKGLAGSGYTKLSWSSGLRVNEKASEVTDGGEPGVEGCGNCGTEFAEDAGVMVCRSCTKKFCVSCQKLCSMGMLFCKKDKLHKLVKEVKGEEGVGGAGEAEGEGGSCVNCSKASPEAVKCLSCGFVFCPSCVKLSRFLSLFLFIYLVIFYFYYYFYYYYFILFLYLFIYLFIIYYYYFFPPPL